jgi:glycosyltransferase involved in cell wall biosynthesis
MALPSLLIGSEWLPYRAGGLNRYFHGLLGAAARGGVRAVGIVTFLRENLSPALPLRAMASEHAGLLARLRGARTAALAAFEEGVSLANPHFALYAWPWIRSMPSGTPLVVNFHGPWADEMLAENRGARARVRAAATRVVERSVYRRADRCITLSSAFAHVLTARYGVPASCVRVIPGGLDLQPYLAAPERAAARARLGWPADRPIVLCVRRLTHRMGLDLLIEAASTLARVHPRLLVLIAGTGHAAGALKAQATALGLDEAVRFLGFVPDNALPAAYAGADVTIMPSVALEGFGLTLVESLASGTPAIGTPVGGIPEALSGLPSLLTTSASADAIASALDAALRNPGGLPNRTECRACAQPYGWDAVWPRVRAVWHEAGADAGGPVPA